MNIFNIENIYAVEYGLDFVSCWLNRYKNN